jgi:hypothetical protein
MANNTALAVRSHSQEREWLLSLGDGNIVAGVRSLIQQAQREATDKHRPKNKKNKPKK